MKTEKLAEDIATVKISLDRWEFDSGDVDYHIFMMFDRPELSQGPVLMATFDNIKEASKAYATLRVLELTKKEKF